MHCGNGDLWWEIAIWAISLPKVVNQVVNQALKVVNWHSHLPKSCESLAKSDHGNWRSVWVVFESPVSRLQKDRNQTGLRLEKTGPAVLVFWFWESKTAKRPVFLDRSFRFRPVWTGEFVPPIYPSKMSPRSLKMVNIWLKNKLNCTMFSKIVDFAEYYCRESNS